MKEELDGGLRPGSVGAISEEEGKFPIDSFSVDMGEKTDTPLLALSREWNFEASRRYYGISGAHTVATDDGVGIFGVTTGASDFGVALPGYAANNGRTITIVKVDSGAGEVTISGGFVTMYLNRQYQKVTVVSNGSVWLKLDGEPSYMSSHIAMGGGLYMIPVLSRTDGYDLTDNSVSDTWEQTAFSGLYPAGVKMLWARIQLIGAAAEDTAILCTSPDNTATVAQAYQMRISAEIGAANYAVASGNAILVDSDGQFYYRRYASTHPVDTVGFQIHGYWMGY